MKRYCNRLFVGLIVAIALVGMSATAAQAKQSKKSTKTEQSKQAEQPNLENLANELDVFIWSQYMNPAIIEKFEDKYNANVVLNYYASLPEMFAKLRAGGTHLYDIIVPSNYYVPRLIETGMVQPLNKELIPNLDNLMDKFKDPPFDPNNQYSAAYQWGTTGLVYNTKVFEDPPKSWAILLDPELNSKYPFVLTTDAQVMFGIACSYLGLPYRCIGAKPWKKAAHLIIQTKQRPNFNGFMANTPMLRQLARGNIVAGIAYNGDYVFVKAKEGDAYAHTNFILPKEGAEIWVDSMMIPADAPHPKLANKFINFILKPKIGAMLSNYNYYATPNKKSVQYLKPVLQEPPVLPTDKQMKRLHFTPSLKGKQLQLLQQLWTAVLSH